MEAAMTIEEHEARLAEIKGRQKEIDAQYAGQALPDEARAEFEELQEERLETQRLIAELTERKRVVEENARDDARTEREPTFRAGRVTGDDIYDLSEVRASVMNPEAAGRELKDRALRAVDQVRFPHKTIDEAEAKRSVQRLIDAEPPDGRFSRYILATGNPVYKRAFPKLLIPNGQYALTREEQAAVANVQAAERALSLTGSAGGFAVPFELDPTILNTSNGVVNPIRQISRVESITVDEWRGVSSTGVTASYAAEATETTDNAPTLAQPTVSTEKAQAFIPFSIEVGMDWGGLREQMSELLQDAKDTLEAAKFVAGTGTNEPFGVLVGTTNTVNAAAGADAFTLANLYTLMGSLPPRYRANGSFLADLLILNRIRQFDTVGSSAAIWVDSLQEGNAARLLGKGVYEASEMPDTAASPNKFLIFGDFSRYLIADRIGLTVDLIPHLFGSNQRPTGQRGLYAYWRNGAKVLDANAFRALIGTA